MYVRLFSFIKKYDLLYKYQFGFRQGFGTDTALVFLIDNILKALDEGEMVLGVYIHLSKAFDTVNHTILLDKLYKYGIRGMAHVWITNYLYDRKQYVSFNKHDSPYEKVNCGVPQGSISGPLFFLMYINDLCNVSSLLFSLLYPDDTNMFVTGKNIENLIFLMNTELKKIVIWLNSNKLSLNVKKIHFIIFSFPYKRIVNTNDIVIDNQPVSRISYTKFLGVIIDEKLNWSEQFKNKTCQRFRNY